MEKLTADFLHQADFKSMNSDKSLTNLIPDISTTVFFDNLLETAQHHKATGGHLEVRATLKCHQGHIAISVSRGTLQPTPGAETLLSLQSVSM